MTYHALLDLFWHGVISLDEWSLLANETHPVAATLAANVFPSLSESAPTWWAMVTALATWTYNQTFEIVLRERIA